MKRQDARNLKKRYLIWLYKTTKEALDRIERKFTQLEVDKFLLEELEKSDKEKKLVRFIDELKTYIQNKEKEGMGLKYENRELSPNYSFLCLKIEAIEKAILKESGKKGLEEIKLLYEIEMTERILKSTEH